MSNSNLEVNYSDRLATLDQITALGGLIQPNGTSPASSQGKVDVVDRVFGDANNQNPVLFLVFHTAGGCR
jgi:hypothetical protein